MKVKITSKEIPEMENMSYDLSIPGHFKGCMDQLKTLIESKKEFTVYQIIEEELYFHNLNHH